MTWPEAMYKIIVEGGGGLVTIVIILALFTDFWENLFGSRIRRVEVLPEDFLNELSEVVVEMRTSARAGEHNATKVIAWAKRITEAIEEATDE
jgi:hypothetical protein